MPEAWQRMNDLTRAVARAYDYSRTPRYGPWLSVSAEEVPEEVRADVRSGGEFGPAKGGAILVNGILWLWRVKDAPEGQQ